MNFVILRALTARQPARRAPFFKNKTKISAGKFKTFVFSFFRTDDPIVVENSKSHGSVTVRYGAIIFGLGAFCYFFIELLVFLEQKPESPCFHPLIGANTIMALLFVFLQTYIIFMYPRLNFQCHKFFNRWVQVLWFFHRIFPLSTFQNLSEFSHFPNFSKGLLFRIIQFSIF